MEQKLMFIVDIKEERKMLELLNEFYIGSEKYCTVQIGKNKNVSVVPEKEYKLIWGKYNPNRWENKEIA